MMPLADALAVPRVAGYDLTLGRSRFQSQLLRSPTSRCVAEASELNTTLGLLARAKAGDAAAMNALFRRCIPPLRRWAHGRLPAYARDLLDTQDLVQDTVMQMLRHVETFDAYHEGAVHAYLREAVLNRIRDELRRHSRRPVGVELDDRYQSDDASPLQQAIGREGLERYETALAKLRPEDREAIVGRLELRYSYRELAANLGKPSADAARVAVTRALQHLIGQLGHAR
jgi:RNA polymerase sigma-70 factor (ECF subfamily)